MKLYIKNFYVKEILQGVLFLIIISCVTNCKNKKEQDLAAKNPVYSVKVDLSEAEKKMFDLSEFAAEPTIIRLETKSDALISSISRVYNYKQYLFIGDGAGCVFVFDTTGRFQFKLGKRGNGPEEFVKVNDWAFNPQTEQFILLDDSQRKIKIFDIMGNFVKEIYEPVYSSTMALLNTGKLVFHNGYNSSNATLPYQLIICNYNNDITIEKYFFPIENIEPGTYYSASQIFSFYKDSTFYHPEASNTVYSIQNDSITPYFNIDFGKANLPEGIMAKDFGGAERLKIQQTRDYINNIEVFYNSPHAIYFNVIYHANNYVAFYLKQEDRLFIANGYSCDLKGLEGLLINEIFFSQSGELFVKVEPGSVFKVLQLYKENNKVAPKGLVEFSKTISISDNPVLLRCKFKANFK